MTGPDYERQGAAATYRSGRTLSDQVLEAWHHAMTVAIDGPVSTILDVGAGTGQFVAPLARWFHAGVVALEPSAAMRGRSSAPALVAGSADAMPIVAGSIDLAWLSAVVHQLPDLGAAAGELRRVLRPGGRVAVRGYFADQGPIGWFGHFPGIERSIARFPMADDVIDAFAVAGIQLQIATIVDEVWLFSAATYAARVHDLRHADSMLVPLTDDEIEAGLTSVAAAHPDPDAVHELHAPLRLLVLAAEG